MTLELLSAPTSPTTDLLLDCVLERAQGDHAAWTMRRLEEVFMDAIEAGESDAMVGYVRASNLLAVLPFMVDADTDDRRLQRFAKSVARTTLRLAERIGMQDYARDLIKSTCALHPAPCLQGMAEALTPLR